MSYLLFTGQTHLHYFNVPVSHMACAVSMQCGSLFTIDIFISILTAYFNRVLEFEGSWSSGQQWNERPSDGTALGAEKHRQVRGESEQSYYLRGERRGRQCAFPLAVSNV